MEAYRSRRLRVFYINIDASVLIANKMFWSHSTELWTIVKIKTINKPGTYQNSLNYSKQNQLCWSYYDRIWTAHQHDRTHKMQQGTKYVISQTINATSFKTALAAGGIWATVSQPQGIHNPRHRFTSWVSQPCWINLSALFTSVRKAPEWNINGQILTTNSS